MNNKILGDKRKSNFDDTLADVVNKMYENMPETPEVKPAVSNVHFALDHEGFNFHGLPGVGDFKLLRDYLLGGTENYFSDWIRFKPNEFIFVPNTIILYQIARALYQRRNDSACEVFVEGGVGFLRNAWIKTYPFTGTKIYYEKNPSAVVYNLQFDSSFEEVKIEIPAFSEGKIWSDLILAKEQPEEQLGEVENIPENAVPILEALLGEGYEEAGAVFQYICSRKNGNLREVRLRTPSIPRFASRSERAVVFGVYDKDKFYIDADCSMVISKPALGVAKIGGFQ